MKANKFLVVISCAVVSFFICTAIASCGERKNEVDLDYKKACVEKDFDKANSIVDYLKKDYEEKYAQYKKEEGSTNFVGQHDWGKINELKALYQAANLEWHTAERYVILQEAMTLLEQGDDGSLMRIVGLAKEHNADNWLYPELIDMANKIGNEELANRLKKMSGHEEK